MFRKTVAGLLAFLLCVPTFLTSCSESKENADTQTADTQTDVTETVTDETVEAETERLYPDIPENVDFGGGTFTILCSSNNEYGIVQNDFHAEELTGEAINDARYNRNVNVSDKLNVVLVDTEAPCGHENGTSYIQLDVKAGTGSYDIATCCGFSSSSLSINSYIYDINKVPYIDLEMPWWDQVANEELTILDQLFYTTGDITTSDNDATYCIMFNKQMLEDYNLDNPYEMVDNGTWTVDKFIDMASQVSMDLDGNGKFDENDRYGAMIWDDAMNGVVNCTGVKCASVNSEGLLELTLNNETTVDILTKFLDFACQKNIACAYQRLNWTDALLVNMFSGDQALFLMQLIQIVPKMREMDTDFGILPYFKYNEAQSEYYSTVGSWHSVFYCVPNGPQDMERVGIVTECLASEGLYDLTEAYYEKTLKGKTTRDAESLAMLDIIFDSRVYDMGWYFLFGEYNGVVMDLLRNYNNNFASAYKTREKVAQKTVDKTNKAFVEAKEEAEG